MVFPRAHANRTHTRDSTTLHYVTTLVVETSACFARDRKTFAQPTKLPMRKEPGIRLALPNHWKTAKASKRTTCSYFAERTFISLAQNQLCNVNEAFAAIKAIHNLSALENEKPSSSNLPKILPILVFL